MAKKPIIVKGSLQRFRNFTYIDDCVKILANSVNNRISKILRSLILHQKRKFQLKILLRVYLM